MQSDFVNWDDLDLDYLLGKNNWTDAEDEEIFGEENEWNTSGSASNDDDQISTSTKTSPATEKENIKPAKRNKIYQCPVCNKEYKSPSGFRGHVLKKHQRTDLKGMVSTFPIFSVSL